MGEILLVDINVEIIHETEAAVLISDSRVEVWVPKSQIDNLDDVEVGEHVTITIPEWLAEQGGLI